MLPPVAPVVTITEDGGGLVDEFADRVLEYRDQRVLVRIEGWCASACTMIAALPKDQVCVGPDAELAFHQSFVQLPGRSLEQSVGNRSRSGTALLWRFYPGRIRAWITKHGGLTASMISLKGRPLRRLFHACEAE